MIKRRFYRLEHGGRDDPSESSSSSDSEVEAESTDESDQEEAEDDGEEENVVSKTRDNGEASSSSGYESEDSSINEVNLDSSGLPTSDDDTSTQIGGENILGSIPNGARDTVLAGDDENSPEEEETSIDLPDWILKCKSVYKCRLCPRIVCLSEDTLKAHLISKRHARSEKLRKEGRLKVMLNGSGQLEGETDDPENPSATTAERKKKGKGQGKRKGQGKQKKRSRQETRFSKGRPAGRREKRQKNDD